MTSPHGSRAEDTVEKILSSCYLADFVVRSPKYKKTGAREKEAADLLLPFRDELICFQVKSRKIPDSKESLDKSEAGRITRRIEKAVQQVKTIREVLSTNAITEVENLRGIRLPFRCKEPRRITGIVVLDVEHPASWSSDERVAICGGLDEVHGISVHVFLMEDFALLANEVDTLPDLFRYLSVREDLMRRGAIFPLTCEKDYLAVYLTQYGLIEDCLVGKISSLVVVEGTWEEVRRLRATEFDDRRQRKQASRIVDLFIEGAYKCIGFDPASERDGGAERTSAPGTKAADVSDYLHVIEELSQLGRIERIEIGSRIQEKAKRADTDPKGFSHFASLSPASGTLFVFLASRHDRAKRREHLWKVAAVAYVMYQPDRLIGIASQNYSADSGSQDYLCMGPDLKFDNEEGLRSVGSQLFQAPEPYSKDEWGNDYLSTPPEGLGAGERPLE